MSAGMGYVSASLGYVGRHCGYLGSQTYVVKAMYVFEAAGRAAYAPTDTKVVDPALYRSKSASLQMEAPEATDSPSPKACFVNWRRAVR